MVGGEIKYMRKKMRYNESCKGLTRSLQVCYIEFGPGGAGKTRTKFKTFVIET